MTANPWLELPAAAPYVVPVDASAVADHNSRAKPEHQFRTGVLPEPFLGAPDAQVVMLNLNPGYTPGDEDVHADPLHQDALRSMLRHERPAHPMYLLDPAFAERPGGVWWRKRLRVLAEEVGGFDALSHRLLVLEAFAYPSVSFSRPKMKLPSSDYVAHLLRQAMAGGRPVVVLRALREWERLVPSLATYEHRYVLKNPRAAYITPRNCPTGFDHLVAALRV